LHKLRSTGAFAHCTNLLVKLMGVVILNVVAPKDIEPNPLSFRDFELNLLYLSKVSQMLEQPSFVSTNVKNNSKHSLDFFLSKRARMRQPNVCREIG
jgi:hypothetical protein